MTAPAAVTARFMGFRSAPARGVMILTLDVPIESGPRAMEALGMPQLGSSIHVGLARMGGPATAGAPAVNGTYESCRTVQGRSALQLIIEVPAERGHSALKSLGVPTPLADIQVAIALLAEQPPPAPLPSKTVGQLAVQQAALRVKDAGFQRFLLGRDFDPEAPAANEAQTTTVLRRLLGIESRKELAADPDKLRAWHGVVGDYERHMQAGRAGEEA